MWELLSRKTQVTVLVVASIFTTYVVGVVWSLVTGETANPWKWISLTVFVVATVLVVVGNLVWRRVWRWVPPLGRIVFPDLNGTYEGELVSTWIDPETGTTLPPIPTTITVRQTLLSTHVSLQTGESRSQSTRAFLEPFADEGRFRIWYSYNNDPKAQVQKRSSPHEGVAYLEVHVEEDRDVLSGRYYTARRTSGDMQVRRRDPRANR